MPLYSALKKTHEVCFLVELSTVLSFYLDLSLCRKANQLLQSYFSLFSGNCFSSRSLAEACSDGDVNAVRKLLDEGRSVNEHTEEGESLLCLACSAGYYELAQVSNKYNHN